jgi:hypothetical protein
MVIPTNTTKETASPGQSGSMENTSRSLTDRKSVV